MRRLLLTLLLAPAALQAQPAALAPGEPLAHAVAPGDDRVLLIVGSGHVAPLRHLLDEAPTFCPVSPLPYLQ